MFPFLGGGGGLTLRKIRKIRMFHHKANFKVYDKIYLSPYQPKIKYVSDKIYFMVCNIRIKY